jgi:predicted DNA-binding transcriptional regulator YafY
MAKTLLTLYRDIPLYPAARRLLETLTIPLAGVKQPFRYENRIVVPPAASAPVQPEVWNTLLDSLRENCVLAFDYIGAWDEEFLPRRVRPYQLLFDTGVWYLYGYAEECGTVRMFSLPRIKNAALGPEAFTLPPDNDYLTGKDGVPDSYFGVFAGGKRRRFRIAFYEEAIVWVCDRKWAADQTIEETANGVIIDFTSTQYEKVFAWVLSQGYDARPLEPAELVSAWRDNAKRTYKMLENP